MKKPSKLKRELARLGQQIADLPERFLGPIARAKYEANRAQTVISTQGARDLTPKLAVFLLFQRGDLPASIKVTCDWLAENGYSVLCVANGGLTEVAKTALLPHVWRLIERPNFGYDFGGYREGILHLKTQKIAPETLLILNDSIWLPTRPHSDLITRLEAMPAPVAGLVLNQRERAKGRYAKAGFVESYFYRISGDFASSDAFATYWNSLKITDDKRLTIQRGEKGFSRMLVETLVEFEALLTRASFAKRLATCGTDELTQYLRFAALPTPDLRDLRDTALATNARAPMLEAIEAILKSHGPAGAFNIMALADQHLDVLKKRPAPICQSGRAAYLAALRAGILPAPAPEILAEIEALAAKETA